MRKKKGLTQEQMNSEALKVMNERFGKDTVLALATIDGDYPAVRYVNAYYTGAHKKVIPRITIMASVRRDW